MSVRPDFPALWTQLAPESASTFGQTEAGYCPVHGISQMVSAESNAIVVPFSPL